MISIFSLLTILSRLFCHILEIQIRVLHECGFGFLKIWFKIDQDTFDKNVSTLLFPVFFILQNTPFYIFYYPLEFIKNLITAVPQVYLRAFALVVK